MKQRRLNREEVQWIIDERNKGMPVSIIAGKLGCHQTVVYGILRGKRQGAFDKPIQERFWERVKKTDTCWLWTGTIVPPAGYGRLAYNGREIFAHRLSWEIHNGSIPDGMLICHHCDNPPCVRPSHLFLGTFSDNFQDAIAKRRIVGERAHNVKLKQKEVDEIRRLYATKKYSQREIGIIFGIRQGHVSRLVNRIEWSHI